MKSVTDYQHEILDRLQNKQTGSGQAFVLVKDWTSHYHFGIWNGTEIDTKSAKYLTCEYRSLFSQAAADLIAKGKQTQYNDLATMCDGVALNVFFGLPEKAHEFALRVKDKVLSTAE